MSQVEKIKNNQKSIYSLKKINKIKKFENYTKLIKDAGEIINNINSIGVFQYFSENTYTNKEIEQLIIPENYHHSLDYLVNNQYLLFPLSTLLDIKCTKKSPQQLTIFTVTLKEYVNKLERIINSNDSLLLYKNKLLQSTFMEILENSTFISTFCQILSSSKIRNYYLNPFYNFDKSTLSDDEKMKLDQSNKELTTNYDTFISEYIDLEKMNSLLKKVIFFVPLPYNIKGFCTQYLRIAINIDSSTLKLDNLFNEEEASKVRSDI